MNDPKTSLLFLINSLSMGGAERALVNLVNRLDSKKYSVTVRVLFDGGVNREHLASHVKYEFIFRTFIRGVNFLSLAPGTLVYRWIARGKYDVIIPYLHGVLTKIVARGPSAQRKIAYLHADMRKSEFFKSFRNDEQVRRCFEAYSVVVAVSKSVEQAFLEVAPWSTNVMTLYNVFELDDIRDRARAPMDMVLPINARVPVICSVGNLTDVKGYARLLRVVNSIISDGIALNLMLVGEGPERTNLERYISQNGLQKSVFLIGFNENPYRYIKSCDIFISSSYSEGMSSVVVEALALGKPIIATNCAGMSEILGPNNEYGIIVDNSEHGLKEGLLKLIQNPQLRKFYANQAIDGIAKFRPERAVEQFEKLIIAVL